MCEARKRGIDCQKKENFTHGPTCYHKSIDVTQRMIHCSLNRDVIELFLYSPRSALFTRFYA